MRTSDQIDAVVAALVKAHADFKPVVREVTGQVGQNRNYKYADLAGVLDSTQPALLKHGIVIIQGPDAETESMVTRLCHTSGQWIETAYPLAKYDRPQDFGSQLTYARRYSIMGLLGVAQEDDDGAAAQHAQRPAAASQPPAKAQPPAAAPAAKSGDTRLISEAQRKRMYAIGKGAGWSDDEMRELLAAAGFQHSRDVTKDAYEALCKSLENGQRDDEPPPDADADGQPYPF